MGRTVMQRIANPYYVFKRRVGSTPTSSAIILFLAVQSCHPVHANEMFLKQYTTVEHNGYYCNKQKKWYAVYLPMANKIELCVENIKNNFPESKVNYRIKLALGHEAVHLAQDCKAGINNTKMHVLNNDLGKISNHVLARYKSDDHKIEHEAWKYQDTNKPYEYVEKYCKRN